jgi:hypothetical protein
MMQHILEYSAWAGAGWFSSNALFVLVWCWLHSGKRPWMHDEDRKLTIFNVLNNETSQEESGSPSFPVYPLGTLEQSEMTLNKAS